MKRWKNIAVINFVFRVFGGTSCPQTPGKQFNSPCPSTGKRAELLPGLDLENFFKKGGGEKITHSILLNRPL
jgi:hypothetical protein